MKKILFSLAILCPQFFFAQVSFQELEMDGQVGRAIFDVNGDFLDDIISVEGSFITAFIQQSDGTLIEESLISETPTYTPDWSLAAGDLDNNGFNDLVYGGWDGASIMMRSDDGTSFTEFEDGTYIFSQRTNMADINMDGNLDAFICHDVAPNVYYLSDGNGDFEFFQGGLGETENGGNYGSIWVDYNNDCLLDMFIAKCRGGDVPENINQMHRNNGDGTYTEVGEEIGLADDVQTWSSSWGDFDNDGDMDVFVGASSLENGSHKLMRNDDGIFTDITSESGITSEINQGIEFTAHDFDNDGYVDIDVSGSTILMNNGDMTFTEVEVGFSNGPVGDLNDDGYLDVVYVWENRVMLNNGGDNNYIKVNPIGTASNKSGIGTRITLESSSGTQIRDVKSGDGFEYMSTLTAHFGLGTDEEIETLTVCWPSGNETVVISPNINQTLNIVEIDGVINVTEFLNEEFEIYPNPADAYLNITSDFNFNSFPVEILDMKGQTIDSKLVKDNRIDITSLSAGNYLLRISANGEFHQVKFIKQ